MLYNSLSVPRPKRRGPGITAGIIRHLYHYCKFYRFKTGKLSTLLRGPIPMATITPPKYVKQILLTLESGGFAAYLVGGCVRDMLMGNQPGDWDIGTGATPRQVLALFPGSVPTGLKHGTVTVKLGSGRSEVTTFRSEEGYTDHRRPDAVHFVGDIGEDLKRRDFTINAMALPLTGLLYDPFGGRADIEARLIRCVGEPRARFEEDALRMFRAFRFSARLGFEIEAGTLAAIDALAPSAVYLAPERIRDELEKMLVSPRPQLLSRVFESGLMNCYVNQFETDPDLAVLAGLPKNRVARWAALCAVLERAGFIDSCRAFLTALRLDGTCIRQSCDAVSVALSAPPQTRLDWKRLLAKYGTETAWCAAAALQALGLGNHHPLLRGILKSGECFSLKRLAVTGDDLLELDFSGPRLGRVLGQLLSHVLENPEDNNRAKLIGLAARLGAEGF